MSQGTRLPGRRCNLCADEEFASQTGGIFLRVVSAFRIWTVGVLSGWAA